MITTRTKALLAGTLAGAMAGFNPPVHPLIETRQTRGCGSVVGFWGFCVAPWG